MSHRNWEGRSLGFLAVVLALPETDSDALARLQDDLGFQTWVPGVYLVHVVLDPVELLEETHERVGHFGEGELLTDADAGPAVECCFGC